MTSLLAPLALHSSLANAAIDAGRVTTLGGFYLCPRARLSVLDREVAIARRQIDIRAGFDQ